MPKLDDKYLLPYVCNKVIDSISVKNNLEISLSGALLFADISGFTAMSEKLAGMGRVGGEKLAEIINDCFNPLLEIVFAWGGDVIKFGGDAILVLFEGDDKTGTALNCASELIRWVREHGKIKSPAGDFNLGIHAGISEGIIYSLIIGRIRKDHLFCGETVEMAYAAADLADLGQIVLTRDAATIIRDIDIESINGEFVKISSAENLPDKEQSHPDRGRIEKRPARIDLDAFIDKRLMEQLYYNKGRIDGEHRIITSLFIGVNSLRNIIEKDPSGSIDTIQEYFETLNDIITRNGGSLARIDSGATSEKILVFFGAPRCFGNDAQNCLRAIIEIEAALKDLNENYRNPIEHRYGVNSGLCFVGDVGGAKRREYTAMGDAINLAARLMSRAAYGETLIGEETVRTCRAEFEFKDCGKIAVKGKSKPVKTCSLISEKQIRQLDTPMIGREREYERVRRYVNDIKERRPAALLISGEPGAGKSLLCLKLKSLATEFGINCFEGACFKQTEKAPYGPIKSILLELLDLSSNSPQKEKRAVLQKSLREIGEGEWETLMAPLLDYYPAVPPYLKNLPEETKKGKIESIIHRLIRESSHRNETIIIIEDIQWIDAASYEIIESLLESGDLPGLLFVGRPGGICDELKKRYKIDEIELGALTEENSKKLFLSLFKEMKPNETIISNVIEKSGGNPFYLEEMAKAFMELGETRFESADNIPSGIESVITARIDNLGEMVKKTVRTASVIGRIFGYHVLKGIFPDRRRSKMLRDYLNELARLDLTPVERIQPALEYIFKHILTQEVAYNGLSFSARKSLHLKTAEYLSARKRLVKRTPETIARHFMLAGDLKRALPYLILSGKKASSEFANKEAFEYYRKALEMAEKLNDTDHISEILKCRGLLARDTAGYKQAEDDFAKMREICGDKKEEESFAERELSFIYRMTGDYQKASDSLGRLESLMAGDIPTRVFCLNGEAEIARRSGKLPECRELLLEALDIIENHEIDRPLTAIVYNNLGICHWSLGRLNDAEAYFKTALSMYRKLKDLGGQSKIINNLGIISDELGKLHRAASSYEKAERIFKRIGATRSEAYACANLGTNFLSRGYLSNALEKLARAKEIFDKIGDRHSSAYTSGDMGYIEYCRGKVERGIALLSDAIKMAADLNDEELLLESKIRLSKIIVYTGKRPVDNSDGLIELARKIGSTELEIKAYILKILDITLWERNEFPTDTLKQLTDKDELENYPELALESAILTFIWEIKCGNEAKAVNLYKQSLKKCFSRDFALITSDFLAAGKGCNILTKIPEKILAKMNEFHLRAQTGLNEIEIRNFAAMQRNKEVLFRESIERSPLTKKIPVR